MTLEAHTNTKIKPDNVNVSCKGDMSLYFSICSIHQTSAELTKPTKIFKSLCALSRPIEFSNAHTLIRCCHQKDSYNVKKDIFCNEFELLTANSDRPPMILCSMRALMVRYRIFFKNDKTIRYVFRISKAKM